MRRGKREKGSWPWSSVPPRRRAWPSSRRRASPPAGLTGFFPIGATAASGYDVAWSLALVGAGHLVGLSVGMAMLAGLVIAWGIAVPILTSMNPTPAGVTLAAHTASIWGTQVRFIGAGAIGVAAVYTLATLAKPVLGGLVSTLAASRAEGVADDRDRDLSPSWIIGARGGMRAHRRRVGLQLRALHGVGPRCGNAHGDRRAVRRDRRVSHRRHLRLHGGAHRRVEQPDFRRRHSVDRGLCIRARHGRAADGGVGSGARRVLTVRHGDRVRLRDDLQRQPAGPQDGPTRGRVAAAAADRAHRGRGGRRGGDSVGAESSRQGLRVRGCAERGRGGAQPAAGAAGDAHLGARARA